MAAAGCVFIEAQIPRGTRIKAEQSSIVPLTPSQHMIVYCSAHIVLPCSSSIEAHLVRNLTGVRKVIRRQRTEVGQRFDFLFSIEFRIGPCGIEHARAFCE